MHPNIPSFQVDIRIDQAMQSIPEQYRSLALESFSRSQSLVAEGKYQDARNNWDNFHDSIVRSHPDASVDDFKGLIYAHNLLQGLIRRHQEEPLQNIQKSREGFQKRVATTVT